jgi:hypothetical protein
MKSPWEVRPLSPKKDSSRIFDMLAKRGLAEPIEPEKEFEDGSGEVEIPSASAEAEAEAVRRFFDEDYSSAEDAPTSGESLDYWSAAAAGTAGPTSDMNDFAEIGDIYRTYGMPLGGVDTVFLLEEYIATLPDSLPAEMRRSIVLKIVTASGFDYDKLLNDGIDRVTKLNEYSASFAERTDEFVAANTAEIEALTQKIEHIKEQIAERKNLHKRQFLAVESEAQRLKEVLDFITK